MLILGLQYKKKNQKVHQMVLNLQIKKKFNPHGRGFSFLGLRAKIQLKSVDILRLKLLTLFLVIKIEKLDAVI